MENHEAEVYGLWKKLPPIKFYIGKMDYCYMWGISIMWGKKPFDPKRRFTPFYHNEWMFGMRFYSYFHSFNNSQKSTNAR